MPGLATHLVFGRDRSPGRPGPGTAVINETERLPSRHLRDYCLQRFRGPFGCVLLHEPDQRVQHHHVQDPECQRQVRHITRQGQEID